MMRWICALLQRLAYLFMCTLVRAVSMTKRRCRECAVLVSFGVVLAIVVFCAGNFSGGGKNRVYAVQSSVQEEDAEADSSSDVKAGLMGIVDSVGCMETYAREVSSVSVQNGYENTLVGTSRVEKGALNRQKMAGELKKVSGVGYYGLMEIRNNQMPKQDYDALLRIVEAEATGGDLKSKVLIANVVLNRVKDERFPDSIYDVVFQYAGGSAQFSPVADGRIYSVEITDDTIQAVDQALEGEDYSQGALFFMARQSSDSSSVEWFDSKLKLLFSYGGHEYFTFDKGSESTEQ